MLPFFLQVRKKEDLGTCVTLNVAILTRPFMYEFKGFSKKPYRKHLTGICPTDAWFRRIGIRRGGEAGCFRWNGCHPTPSLMLWRDSPGLKKGLSGKQARANRQFIASAWTTLIIPCGMPKARIALSVALFCKAISLASTWTGHCPSLKALLLKSQVSSIRRGTPRWCETRRCENTL